MSVTYPRLKPLRRMLEEPELHAQRMAGLGEVMQNALAEGTLVEKDAAFSRYLKELAAAIVAAEKRNPKPPDAR